MKILLEFSRSGLPIYRKYIELIRNYILQNGHKLVTDLLKETNNQGQNDLPKEVFSKISRSISQAQCVIIEASEVSLSLGYILTKAISLGKPVLLLRHKESNLKKSRFAESIKSKLLKVSMYANNEELLESLIYFLNQNKNIKTRFNLVMTNEIDSFVTQESKEKNISKTKYIIDLIKKSMKEKKKN
ncbi:MAG: hypothetical protein N2558_03370 [Patescibacteria group bacterium]|nr:hypothetical protein [Patescibacteria group bacterium]